MSKFIVIVFPGESQAYEGTRALKELHAEGSLTLYGLAVVSKDAKGNFGVKQAADDGPLGMPVGALVGALVGVIGGPVGALAGAAGGALFGGVVDLVNYGVSEDFVWTVSKNMVEPGKTAVVAEIGETWTAPLDTRMEALGGTVMRTWRVDFEDEQLASELTRSKADLDELRAEFAQANAEAKAKLKAKVDKAKASLDTTQSKVKARVDAIEKEANAKIAALEQQIKTADAGAREKIRERIAALRVDYETRTSKLKQAWTLTKEALAA
jgi:uncharacterized membrane protein